MENKQKGRRARRRSSDKTWEDLSTIDNKGFLDTFDNQKLTTPGRRKSAKTLPQCSWVRYRIPELTLLMPGDWATGPVPKLVLTDPEGRHYELEDARHPTQRALPQI